MSEFVSVDPVDRPRRSGRATAAPEAFQADPSPVHPRHARTKGAGTGGRQAREANRFTKDFDPNASEREKRKMKAYNRDASKASESRRS